MARAGRFDGFFRRPLPAFDVGRILVSDAGAQAQGWRPTDAKRPFCRSCAGRSLVWCTISVVGWLGIVECIKKVTQRVGWVENPTSPQAV